MFAPCGASLNRFIIGVERCWWGLFEWSVKRYFTCCNYTKCRWLLFDVVYIVVPSRNKEEWLWFLSMVAECLGGLKRVTMLSFRHLWENFVTTTAKHEICFDAYKDLVKEMFSKVAYMLTQLNYDVDMRSQKHTRHRWQHGYRKIICNDGDKV